MAARKSKTTRAKSKAANSKVVAKPRRKSPRKTAAKAKSSAKSRKAAPKKRNVADVIAATEVIARAAPFQLPERFDSAAAASVLDGFKRHRGGALTVDASAVRRVGAQGLQILLSATRTWQADGHVLEIANASAELIDAAQLLGLSHSDLSISGSLQ